MALTTAHPLFFHDQDVLVAGTFRQSEDALWLTGAGDTEVRVIRSAVAAHDKLPTGSVEVSGRVWDVGRLDQRDQRLRRFPYFQDLTPDRWPARGTLIVLALEQALPASPPSAGRSPQTRLREVALYPEIFRDQRIEVTGQFHGANLYGDVPTVLAGSRWNYVLTDEGASVWVTGLRPRGSGFDLDPRARLDTGTWLRVTGTLNTIGGIDALAATAVQKVAAPEPSAPEPSRPVAAIELHQVIAPEVVFSEPLDGDADVPPRDPIRIQFSREMKEESFAGHIILRYDGETSPQASPQSSVLTRRSESTVASQGPPVAGQDLSAPTVKSPLAFTLKYDSAQRAITLRPDPPLEPLRRIRVELLPGITAVDAMPLKGSAGGPDKAFVWTITFRTGR